MPVLIREEVFAVDIGEWLAVLVPLVLLQLGLMIWAIADLIKRGAVRGGSKVVWAIVIIVFNILGPIVYLAWGRQE